MLTCSIGKEQRQERPWGRQTYLARISACLIRPRTTALVAARLRTNALAAVRPRLCCCCLARHSGEEGEAPSRTRAPLPCPDSLRLLIPCSRAGDPELQGAAVSVGTASSRGGARGRWRGAAAASRACAPAAAGLARRGGAGGGGAGGEEQAEEGRALLAPAQWRRKGRRRSRGGRVTSLLISLLPSSFFYGNFFCLQCGSASRDVGTGGSPESPDALILSG